jgi:hypothetical protein
MFKKLFFFFFFLFDSKFLIDFHTLFFQDLKNKKKKLKKKIFKNKQYMIDVRSKMVVMRKSDCNKIQAKKKK